MKRVYLYNCIFLIFICMISFAQEQDHIIILGTITYGSDKKELGYEPDKQIPGAGFPSPIEFGISYDNQIYIYDWAKQRIAKYDTNLIYLDEIRGAKMYWQIYAMKIDELGNIFLQRDGIYKHSDDGSLLCFIENKKLSKNARAHKNYFPYKGYLFYYDDNYNLQCLDKNGNKMSADDLDKLHTEAIEQTETVSRTRDPLALSIVNKYNKDKKKLFFRGNNLYINDKDRFLEYISYKQEQIKKDTTRSINNSKNIISKNYIMTSLLGYDESDNAYWQSVSSILVISASGELLENIEYDGEKYFNPQIAPNGDIYFWDVKPEGVTFYKITRQW